MGFRASGVGLSGFFGVGPLYVNIEEKTCAKSLRWSHKSSVLGPLQSVDTEKSYLSVALLILRHSRDGCVST